MVKKGHYEYAICPFQGISNESLLSFWSEYAITNKKVKYYSCKKRTKKAPPLRIALSAAIISISNARIVIKTPHFHQIGCVRVA